MPKTLHNGWNITFRKHVHMYSHSLKASKDGKELHIPCEDLAVSDGIGIWPYDLELDSDTYSELIAALRNWANAQKIEYRLYTTQDNFESNK